MAVKASATITLSCYRDVESITRYYKLQSSTLAMPVKPSTNPPEEWVDSEPNYVSGSTNTLYFVDLTVFSNGEWSYSNVSVSSSYEAAKEAYNKAVAAQNSVDKTKEDLSKEITDQSTKVLSDAVSITMSAMEECVQKNAFDEYKTNTETRLSVLSDGFNVEIETVKKKVDDIEGDIIEASEKMRYEYSTEDFTVSKDGADTTTHISENGMKIKDSLQDDVLKADSHGVDAKNLHARTYLIIGNNSRVEDYEEDGEAMTGVFWIGN